MSNFEVIEVGGGRFIKAWRKGVVFEDKAIEQLEATAKLPFIYKYIAAMPDTHWGIGATIGTVLPTLGAVVPAAVGVDIGCGMLAIQVTKSRGELGDLAEVRKKIEKAVPVGRTNNGGAGDRGAWSWEGVPDSTRIVWVRNFADRYERLCARHPGAKAKNTFNHLGTLGTGNHFIELAEDGDGLVWLVLHSGSRGLGNRIGTYFIEVAKKRCAEWFVQLPAPDLAYLVVGSQDFEDYRNAVTLAQEFAWENRLLMKEQIFATLGLEQRGPFVHCHHNYIAWEHHYGKDVIVTRKGAVRAREGDLGIIPGSMGARTYIVRGKGSKDSFETCSHGAGRAMGRKEAERKFTLEDHIKATEGVECLKDASVLDETPGAYKDIEAVMAAQSDLVEPLFRLKQFVCVKGGKD